MNIILRLFIYINIIICFSYYVNSMMTCSRFIKLGSISYNIDYIVSIQISRVIDQKCEIINTKSIIGLFNINVKECSNIDLGKEIEVLIIYGQKYEGDNNVLILRYRENDEEFRQLERIYNSSYIIAER